jgi:putative membrane protein
MPLSLDANTLRTVARPAKRSHLAILTLVLMCLVWSAIRPHDYFTWFLEVAPVFIVAALILPTYYTFRLTTLLYVLLAIHACILMIGGHFTYAEVPLFNSIRDSFHLGRNHYDRLGHFVQGFVPFILTRELLARRSPLRQGKWLSFLSVAVCLAFSAFYELIEWWTAIASGEASAAFLGTQGDPWDTQWDMFMALIGASTSMIMLSRVHNKALERLLGR